MGDPLAQVTADMVLMTLMFGGYPLRGVRHGLETKNVTTS